MLIAISINAMCICAVNCFILISGYFKIKVSPSKYFYIIFSLLIYAILLTIIPYIIQGSYNKAIRYSLFLSHSTYWFVIDYLFLMVFAPMINLYYDKAAYSKRKILLLGLLIISCYFGFIWNHKANTNGYTIIQFITMYCIGRELRIRDYNKSTLTSLIIYLSSAALIAFSGYMLWAYSLNELAWKITSYNNPFVILEAIGLFLLFKNINIYSRIINILALSSFGIYLFQESYLIKRVLCEWIQKQLYLGHDIWLAILMISIGIAIIAIIFDQLRLSLLQLIIPKLQTFLECKKARTDK